MLAEIPAKLQFWTYRLGTAFHSLKALYQLSPEKVEAFLNSYDIYDHDWANEKAFIEKMGANYYAEVKKKLIDCYSVWNHLCAIGQVEKMYIPPALDLTKSIIKNQILFEEKMSKDLMLGKGDRALDIGCGRGRVASHMASLTGAHVTGINIDTSQLESGKRFAKGHGLEKQTHFQVGDLNEIPFPFKDGTFDAIYHIQVFSLSKDLNKLFKELHRLLKPGKRFACLDWVSLPAYNPKNPHHATLMKRIKPLIGAIGTPTIDEYIKPMEKAGFKILVNENASIDGLQSPLIANADRFYTRVKKLIKILVKCKVLPKHFDALFERLTKDGQAFVEADKMRLVTTSHYIVAERV